MLILLSLITCSLLSILGRVESQYNVLDTAECAFPFFYNGRNYTTCYDKERKHPWCSLTPRFRGAWKYCHDTTKTNWVCDTRCTEINDDYPNCHTKNRLQMYCLDRILKLDKKPVGNCPPSYRNISEFHTACLAPLPNVAKKGVSEAEKKIIVDLHNDWRRRVEVPASGMVKMYWDNDLSYVAQKHAERCSFYHDDMVMRSIPDTGKYPGQNIVMTSGHHRLNWSHAFNEMFAGELKRWTYGVGIKKEFTGKTALHYTQIMLEHLSRVGCGYAECVFVDRVERNFVCNYDAMQKGHEIVHPYKKGTPCSQCGPSNCDNKLCDCAGKQCFNGGSMDLKTCTCKCFGFWKGPTCSTPIIPVQQPNGCYSPFMFNEVLYDECAISDDMRFCSKDLVVEDTTEVVECDEEQSARNRDKRSIGSLRLRKRRDLPNTNIDATMLTSELVNSPLDKDSLPTTSSNNETTTIPHSSDGNNLQIETGTTSKLDSVTPPQIKKLRERKKNRKNSKKHNERKI